MNGIETTTPGLFGAIPEGQLYLLVQFLYGVAGFVYVGHLVARRSPVLGPVATVTFGAGVGFHLLLLATRGFQAGHPPWMNFYEAVMSVAFVTAASYFVLERFTGLRVIGPFAAALVFLLLVHGAALPEEFRGTNLMPALRDTFWRAIHVPTGMIAYGAFFISAAATLLYVRKQFPVAGKVMLGALALGTLWGVGHLLRTPSAGHLATSLALVGIVFLPVVLLMTERGAALLPSEEALDVGIYRTIGFAYPFQFLLLITGAAWANEAWGRWWGWDQKETWAFVTFMVYTLYLHVRLMRGSRGWAAALSMLGALSVAITFWGVSFFPAIASKFHSYAKPQGAPSQEAPDQPTGPAAQPPTESALPEGHPDISEMEPQPGMAPPLEGTDGELPPGHPPLDQLLPPDHPPIGGGESGQPGN